MQYPLGLAVALLVVVGCSDEAGQDEIRDPAIYDVWIRGGTVVDGTGTPARRADVLISGDRIAWVGVPAADREIHATTTIDAGGLVVAPGFIDAHAHGDPIRTPAFASFLAMGVTTICLGQDGSSHGDRDPGGWLDRVAAARPGVNVCSLAGHGTLRRLAGIADGANAPATDALGRLSALVGRYLDAGYLGLSFGLEYTPGRFATAAEIVAASRPVADRNGVLMAHVRNEDSGAVVPAVREFLDAAAVVGARAHVSHLKIVLGNDLGEADQLLALMGSFRSHGNEVTADLYPYLASFTGLSILFPEWARAPHPYASVAKERRQELLDHLERRVLDRNGPAAMRFGSGPMAGKTLAEVAAEREQPFPEVLLSLGPRGGSAAYFVMNADVMHRLLGSAHVCVASDGSPTMRHPRGHGTFARVAGPMVRDGVLDLATAVYKMTGLPAAVLRLADRGRLEVGGAADVVVFDPRRITDLADFEDPHRHASGVRHVVVNGVVARKDGAFNELRGGRVLRRQN